MSHTKKLIEVALPLPEINDASAYDKMPGIGPHPKGIHHWWARLPLPAARAVLFASVVDDPESHPEKWPTEDSQNAERERLFDLLRKMMGKKLHDHPDVYNLAKSEMLKYCNGSLPSVFDPFSGGGSIPLEANRIGFKTYAGDLNPVAVLLNKCNLELAPRWIDLPPVNPEARRQISGKDAYNGTHGLAEDVRHYARVVLNRAQKVNVDLYPAFALPREHGGGSASVVAWLWARTVVSPHPHAHGKHVPLVSSYWLCRKKGAETWLQPVVNKAERTYRFEIRTGSPGDRDAVNNGTKLGRGAKFFCILTGEPIEEDHIRREANAGRVGYCLLAVVVEGRRGRLYYPASESQAEAANVLGPEGEVDELLAEDPRNIWCVGYGLRRFRQLFTGRQLTALVTMSDLVRQLRTDVVTDAHSAGLSDKRAAQYAETVLTFLALAIDRACDFNNSLCRWSPTNQKVMNLFGRQAIPMVWDFAEANLFGQSVGSWITCSEYVADCIEVITTGTPQSGEARQADAATGVDGLSSLLVSTDPPYYDNISYAGLSDFFYVWLRRTVGDLHQELFNTVLVPKMAELTASPERFDRDRTKAKNHFESGFRKAFTSLKNGMDTRFPLTVYYAFKQDDEEGGNEADIESAQTVDLTTGWETLLEALISSGFQITGTWPIRASQAWRMRAMGANALASYIVLACRPRPSSALAIDRRSFITELKREMPSALRHLQQGNVAPVDFAQAAIGPGMAIYSRYSRVLEANGDTMSVRKALYLINQTLTEVLSEQEDDFDAETRWAIAWFEQHGFSDGAFGDAELLSKAKVTTVAALQQAGIVSSKGGKVRLIPPDELHQDWSPESNKRLTTWEMTHHLLRLYYHEKVGDQATSAMLRAMGASGDSARDLAYRLFSICEKRKRSQEAQAYNALVLGWPEIARMARDESRLVEEQDLFS